MKIPSTVHEIPSTPICRPGGVLNRPEMVHPILIEFILTPPPSFIYCNPTPVEYVWTTPQLKLVSDRPIRYNLYWKASYTCNNFVCETLGPFIDH